MSNDTSVVVVKTHNVFNVDVIAGIKNLKVKTATDVQRFVGRMEQKHGKFATEEAALDAAEELYQDFVYEFDDYPDYGIIKLDLSQYLR